MVRRIILFNFLSKPQAWYIITARRAVYIVSPYGAVSHHASACISLRLDDIPQLVADDMQRQAVDLFRTGDISLKKIRFYNIINSPINEYLANSCTAPKPPLRKGRWHGEAVTEGLCSRHLFYCSVSAKSKCSKTIPQSALLTAPFIQGSLGRCKQQLDKS